MIRSLFSVSSIWYQPRPGSPTTKWSGTNTSSRNTSHDPTDFMPTLGICRIDSPSLGLGTRKIVMPWAFFGTFCSLRAMSRRYWLTWAAVDQIFEPVIR